MLALQCQKLKPRAPCNTNIYAFISETHFFCPEWRNQTRARNLKKLYQEDKNTTKSLNSVYIIPFSSKKKREVATIISAVASEKKLICQCHVVWREYALFWISLAEGSCSPVYQISTLFALIKAMFDFSKTIRYKKW